ncbi:MAG: glycosyltransferase family 4 protein [Phyllobacteriaceae bacterium]|nr:glycosyltransferase family 4 protein [Phyllobacteriaceae bacterium]
MRRLGVFVKQHARTVAHGVAQLLPRPKLDSDTSSRRDGPIERIVVFARLPNPTIDYYLAARLAAPGMPPSQIVDIRDPTLPAIEAEGTFVIVCRYASRRMVTWIDRNANRLAGVGFFTDDNIGAVITGSEARLGYRLFLYQRGLAPLRRLNRHIDVMWVPTPALAAALGGDTVRLMPPAPDRQTWASAAAAGHPCDRPQQGPVRIVYHATGVHRREHTFLAPVIAEVLQQRPNVVFEVTADTRAARAWEGIERVTVVRPTSWVDYLDRTLREPADIAVVPLLKSRANHVRAGTKRIDVVRLGAAGVFSQSAAYGDIDDSGEIRLPNRRKVWVQTLLRLVDEPELRGEVALASRRLVEAMTELAEEGIPDLLTPGGPTFAPPPAGKVEARVAGIGSLALTGGFAVDAG